jgi:hypothetical protein
MRSICQSIASCFKRPAAVAAAVADQLSEGLPSSTSTSAAQEEPINQVTVPPAAREPESEPTVNTRKNDDENTTQLTNAYQSQNLAATTDPVLLEIYDNHIKNMITPILNYYNASENTRDRATKIETFLKSDVFLRMLKYNGKIRNIMAITTEAIPLTALPKTARVDIGDKGAHTTKGISRCSCIVIKTNQGIIAIDVNRGSFLTGTWEEGGQVKGNVVQFSSSDKGITCHWEFSKSIREKFATALRQLFDQGPT